MTPTNILIEWSGPVDQSHWHADLAHYHGTGARELVLALASGADALRAVAAGYEEVGLSAKAIAAGIDAALLGELVRVMRAEG